MNSRDYLEAIDLLNQAKLKAYRAQENANALATQCALAEQAYVNACREVRDREREVADVRTGIPGKRWALW